ncbi:uncharacterized protein [Eulemur rufifrons]|uniref:uncharacterized protein n=1 Tax=Eulemur rufifrons TaxID=859984 RepID=UPI003742D025
MAAHPVLDLAVPYLSLAWASWTLQQRGLFWGDDPRAGSSMYTVQPAGASAPFQIREDPDDWQQRGPGQEVKGTAQHKAEGNDNVTRRWLDGDSESRLGRGEAPGLRGVLAGVQGGLRTREGGGCAAHEARAVARAPPGTQGRGAGGGRGPRICQADTGGQREGRGVQAQARWPLLQVTTGWGWSSSQTGPPSRPADRTECGLAGRDNLTLWAHYDNFHVHSEHQFYQLTLGPYSGHAGDGCRGSGDSDNQEGSAFSTLDRDRGRCTSCVDGTRVTSCSRDHLGTGCWYSTCGQASLNGPWPEHAGNWPSLRGAVGSDEWAPRASTLCVHTTQTYGAQAPAGIRWVKPRSLNVHALVSAAASFCKEQSAVGQHVQRSPLRGCLPLALSRTWANAGSVPPSRCTAR